MGAFHDAIANDVLSAFEALPASRKPRRRADAHEWVPLSGIVLGTGPEQKILKCVALGTGMQCLSSDALALAQGIVLHDWHAEVLAIRAFNLFLLRQCQDLLSGVDEETLVVRNRRPSERSSLEYQSFAIRDDVRIYMYSSEAPCGDASMHLTVAASDDPTPWHVPESKSTRPNSPTKILHGRDHFSILGVVRTKPSRPDAPPTSSKSCSDKLALHSALSLCSSITSILIHPSNAYLTALVIPASQHSPTAAARAFSTTGRLSALAQSSSFTDGYTFHPLDVRTTTLDFAYSRAAAGPQRPVGSDITSFFIPAYDITQTLTRGRLRGRPAGDPLGACMISRRQMWKAFQKVVSRLPADPLPTQLLQISADGSHRRTYAEFKKSPLLRTRAALKAEIIRDGGVLPGWRTGTTAEQGDAELGL